MLSEAIFIGPRPRGMEILCITTALGVIHADYCVTMIFEGVSKLCDASSMKDRFHYT